MIKVRRGYKSKNKSIKSLGHHYVLGYECHILAVVDWIENMRIPSFFNPSQSCRGGTTNS
ncbi:hypothetical protein A6J61_01290 [Staphylococcus lugdunensis]|nr:hypothetical protein A6J61_01290 [Staphylococcus lugdunensis]ARJ08454.1 hypothetical protein B7454_03335 [Staphylococcus lugdunensis]ARJ18063.1 hypothetical protein B7467_03290 [Staphylococcus lugdunensis]AUY63182.1 hypothetical protein AL501_12435 [Staphylococcus lugdunensis]PNZ63091.1 hypothetical protein CD041_08255 [Staphylococcus lugdunensis]